MTNQDAQRVFFALWPEDPLRAQLTRVAAALRADGRPVPERHLHLTLAFPGTVASAVVPALIEGANALAIPALDLTLDRLGYFPRPRVAWIGPSVPPSGLPELAAALGAVCARAGVALDARTFRPHVTLRRFVSRFEAAPVEPLAWTANRVVLVESGRGGHPGPYRILRGWPR